MTQIQNEIEHMLAKQASRAIKKAQIYYATNFYMENGQKNCIDKFDAYHYKIVGEIEFDWDEKKDRPSVLESICERIYIRLQRIDGAQEINNRSMMIGDIMVFENRGYMVERTGFSHLSADQMAKIVFNNTNAVANAEKAFINAEKIKLCEKLGKMDIRLRIITNSTNDVKEALDTIQCWADAIIAMKGVAVNNPIINTLIKNYYSDIKSYCDIENADEQSLNDIFNIISTWKCPEEEVP